MTVPVWRSRDNNWVPGLLGVLFVALKLTGQIGWSWWWVTLPFWGALALWAALSLFILAAVIVMKCAATSLRRGRDRTRFPQ